MTTRTLPTWLKVIVLGACVVLAVGLVALIGLLVPPIGEAIRGAPVVVVVLVVGTVLVLGSTIRATLRRR
jgi:ABC-type Fe3+-siderophore transport system permease subunit